jgi:hypothetical protein
MNETEGVDRGPDLKGVAASPDRPRPVSLGQDAAW